MRTSMFKQKILNHMKFLDRDGFVVLALLVPTIHIVIALNAMFKIVGGPEASFVNALSLGLQRLSFKPVWVPRIIPSRFATNSNFRFINHKLKMNSKLQCINACIFFLQICK